jgi:hypothetical protein
MLSATWRAVTGASKDFSEPSGRVILGMVEALLEKDNGERIRGAKRP